jgi:hypothetical protein
MNDFDNETKRKMQKMKLEIKQYVKDNRIIPLEEHKQLGLSLELMRLRLHNKIRYRTKTSTYKQRKITKKIEELKGILEDEFTQQYNLLETTNGVYYGRDIEVYAIIDKNNNIKEAGSK